MQRVDAEAMGGDQAGSDGVVVQRREALLLCG